MPALSQAFSCAKCYINMQPFTWVWSNSKCVSLQLAQRPGASLKQLRLGMGICCGLNCCLCCYLGFVGLCLTCRRAASESCLHISRQLNCSSMTICQRWRDLSTTVRGGYCGRILYAHNKWSRLGLSRHPLWQKGKELLFRLQFVNHVNQVSSNLFMTQSRHYFYASIHCVAFLRTE